VRLISNLETATEKLIQIVLIGQPELNELLAQRDLRQLAQRITARYHLNPLGKDEMIQYIRHRLAVAGGIENVRFTNRALSQIHKFSRGIPRLINLVCDRALLAAFVLEKGQIDGAVVRRAVKELGPPPVLSDRGFRRRLPFRARTAWLALAALIGLGAVYLARAGVLGRGPSMATPPPAAVEMSADDVDELFELRLAGLSPEASRRAASTVLLERWGIPSGVSLGSGAEDMPALADKASLQYSELETSLGQLRAFDLPAVLEMVPPSGGDVRFLTLTGLHADSATVHFGPGEFFRVPTAVLSRFWNGRARVFWRDFDELEGSDVPSRLAWAGARLTTLGMLPGASNPTPSELLEAVKKLQEQLHLQPDGNLGEMTRMALYSLSGGYSVPRLREP
jgi:general secretion pathway protein A